MARTRWRVRTIAREEGLPAEDVAILLMYGGLTAVTGPDSYIDRSEIFKARGLIRSHRTNQRLLDRLTAGDEEPAPFVWPKFRAEPISYMSAAEIRDIHEAITAEFVGTDDAIEPPGIKDFGLLDSAVNRPSTAAAKYATVPAAAAALTHGLIQNHPFHNGNKRTALVAMVVFLQVRNSYFVRFNEDDLYSFVVSLADHSIANLSRGRHSADLETYEAFRWIRDRTSPGRAENRRIKWHELERILAHFGCTFANRGGNRKAIWRDGPKFLFPFRNMGMEVEPVILKRIRELLELDAAHGVDDAVFFGRGEPYKLIDNVIQRYRGVLHRLALLDRT